MPKPDSTKKSKKAPNDKNPANKKPIGKNKTKASPSASLPYRIVSIAKKIEDQRLEALTQMGLAKGQDDFLLALLTTDGITMGSLAETLSISASSATKAAIKLEAGELIRREASRVDSRQNYAFLTPKGREAARDIVARYEALDRVFCGRLTDKGSERLANILDKLENKSRGAGKQPKKAGSKKKKKKAAKGKKST